VGAYQEGSFAEYLRYRMLCGFSLFTLYKPYLMIMYLVRQCNLLHSSCSENVLERDMKAYRRAHPGCTEEEVIRNCLKFSVPSTIPGTPGWHYQALQDLLAMVKVNGMPQLFWTATMDDVSACCLYYHLTSSLPA
jgi:ATP-dependent DNA helicase PIF1